jgi:hypothetical protein
MARKSLPWAMMLTLLPVFTCGSCLPGEDISARADITFREQTQANAGASIAYTDPTGNPGEESHGELASVALETTVQGATSNRVTSFVAPDAGAPIYFTNTRSFYRGASLEGKCVKLIGRFCVNGASYQLDDGAVLPGVDPATGRKIGIPCPVILRTDLLTSLPQNQDRVIVQGVCRRENDGKLVLLPLSDSAIAQVR